MLQRIKGNLSYANVMATIAVFLALGGGALAVGLPGHNTVRSDDIVNGQVRSGDIANNRVRAGDLAVNSVFSAEIADGAVASAEIANEAVTALDLEDIPSTQVVGAAGAPPFGDGGEGDCVYSAQTANLPSFVAQEPGFYRDLNGIVHLTGLIRALEGTGGDTFCNDPLVEPADGIMFVLPAGYRPPADINVWAAGGTGDDDSQILTVTSVARTVNGQPVPGGAVMTFNDPNSPASGIWTLDGISFRNSG
jgi:hypothetical protein